MRTHTYLTGALVARIGDETAGPALLLAGFALAGSSAEASALLAGITLSAAVGGPVLGALLDGAARPGRLLACALVLYATGLTLVLLGLGRLPFAVTVATAVVTGLLGPALSGGWSAQLPRVATTDRLPRANALDTLTFTTAALAGPALAGGLAEVLGAPTAVVASAALIAAAAPAAWALPTRGAEARGAREARAARVPRTAAPGEQAPAASRFRDVQAPPAGDSRSRTTRTSPARESRAGGPSHAGTPEPPGVGRALVAGTRAVLRNRSLARATRTSVVSCVAQGMLTACVPLLGSQVLGGAGRGAVLLSCAAVSALVANALLARFPLPLSPDALVRAGALVQAAAPALALTGSPAALVAGFLVSGLGEGPQLTALFAVRHRESPTQLRGQVFTTGASLKITGFALGAAAAGPLAAWSLPAALTAATATALLAAAPRHASAPGAP
ncbi:MFS transporter [Streptomyces sp. NRRL B-24572]|uniref:MFS transporter n=1 Tax=Streptomyces sp. NRRL B-24572 TaxID=1962156 RepID=UPI000A35FAC3|nr:MFS transporter [Streptomyces sp. NRRL B-24572]